MKLEKETKSHGVHVQRHRLQNGLRIITAVDRQAPIVSYQTWVGVGSRHEMPGQTGAAHFLEHLMFMQTEKTPLGEFDRRIEESGGDNNAATWVDWTFYRDSVPKGAVQDIITLERDRFSNLTFGDGTVESEREVIVNERLLRVEDDPDGFLEEELFRLALPDHPYGWPTIGWMDDIRGLSIDALRGFYDRYYSPGNATLVVVGDFERDAMLSSLATAYGDLQAPPVTHPEIPPSPPQQKERFATYKKPVSAARVLLGYHAPGQTHDDWLPLSLLGALLSAGPSSRLYRELVVDQEVATSVDAGPMPFAAPSLFRLSAQATPETDPQVLAERIDDVLSKLVRDGLDPGELDKLRSGAEVELWLELETCDGRAEALGHHEMTSGDYARLFDHADAIARVEADDIVRVAETYLRTSQCTSVHCTPEGA